MASGTSTPRMSQISQAALDPTSPDSIEIRTAVMHTQEWLKLKPSEGKTIHDCVRYASLQRESAEIQFQYKDYLRNHPKVKYDPETKLYSYKPTLDIRTADQLLAYLQNQKSAQGVSVKDLKDGWNDVETEAIDSLEAEHKLLVIRNKKDNHAKHVWADDPTLHVRIDGEFQTIWRGIPLPEQGEIVKELTRAGLTPAGKTSAPVIKKAKVEKTKKKARRSGKTTNQHMVGILRDYSHLKP
ncbi:MAG: hypothetical protein Q9227_000971 [Pyrenula ochraceoflavens]